MENKITINLNELTEIQKEKLLYILRQFEEDNCFECESISNSIDLLQKEVYEPKVIEGHYYEL